MNCVIAGALYVARTLRMGHAYLVLLLVAIIALNVAYTGFTGLVSDMVAPEQVVLLHIYIYVYISNYLCMYIFIYV